MYELFKKCSVFLFVRPEYFSEYIKPKLESNLLLEKKYFNQ